MANLGAPLPSRAGPTTAERLAAAYPPALPPQTGESPKRLPRLPRQRPHQALARPGASWIVAGCGWCESGGGRGGGRPARDQRRRGHPDPVVVAVGTGDEQLEGGAGDLVERHPHRRQWGGQVADDRDVVVADERDVLGHGQAEVLER